MKPDKIPNEDKAITFNLDVMRMSATRKGIMKCHEWLTNCIELGYKKEQLDELEYLFWKYKDENGN